MKPAILFFLQHPRMNLHFRTFLSGRTPMGSVNDTRYHPEAWHLRPDTCAPLFPSTSPDEPSFSHFSQRATRMGSVNDTRYRPEAWHLRPDTCAPLFSSTSPDGPSFSHFSQQADSHGFRKRHPVPPGSLAPETRHLRSFVFFNISGWTFIFALFSAGGLPWVP